MRSECPLPPVAHSSLCLSSSVPPLPPIFSPRIPVSLPMAAATNVRGRGRGRGYRRGRSSGNRPDPGMLGYLTVQISRVPRHQRGLPTGMMDAGVSLREPCVLSGAGGPPSPIPNFRGAGRTADVAPTRWITPGVNL